MMEGKILIKLLYLFLSYREKKPFSADKDPTKSLVSGKSIWKLIS